MAYQSKADLRVEVRRLHLEVQHLKRSAEIDENFRQNGWDMAQSLAKQLDVINGAGVMKALHAEREAHKATKRKLADVKARIRTALNEEG